MRKCNYGSGRYIKNGSNHKTTRRNEEEEEKNPWTFPKDEV